MGYYPWAETSDGASLAPYHQACVRMMRADYCGGGKPFTVTGKRIQVLIHSVSASARPGAMALLKRCGASTGQSV